MCSREIRFAFNSDKWQPAKNQLLASLAAISSEERERIMKFRFTEDLKLSLVGRLLIRKCICNMLPLPWEKITLSRTHRGKPVLVNKLLHSDKNQQQQQHDQPLPQQQRQPQQQQQRQQQQQSQQRQPQQPQQQQQRQQPQLYFNASHAGDYVVCAGSTSQNVGVDVMHLKPPNNTTVPKFFQLMNKICTRTEWEYINSFTEENEQMAAFYRAWTLKESYVKATGTGIGTDLAGTLNFDMKTKVLGECTWCSDSVLSIGDIVQPWRFDECMLDRSHVVTVAREDVGELQPVPDFEFLTFEEIEKDMELIVDPREEWWDDYCAKGTKSKLTKNRHSGDNL